MRGKEEKKEEESQRLLEKRSVKKESRGRDERRM